MAKIKPHRAQWTGWKHRPRISAGVGKRGIDFEACVSIGRDTVCSVLPNPRKALGLALQKLGGRILRKRSGAFAGYSRKNRRVRRSRRYSKRRG